MKLNEPLKSTGNLAVFVSFFGDSLWHRLTAAEKKYIENQILWIKQVRSKLLHLDDLGCNWQGITIVRTRNHGHFQCWKLLLSSWEPPKKKPPTHEARKMPAGGESMPVNKVGYFQVGYLWHCPLDSHGISALWLQKTSTKMVGRYAKMRYPVEGQPEIR